MLSNESRPTVITIRFDVQKSSRGFVSATQELKQKPTAQRVALSTNKASALNCGRIESIVLNYGCSLLTVCIEVTAAPFVLLLTMAVQS